MPDNVLDDFLNYILFDKKGIPRKRPDIMLCILKVCLENESVAKNDGQDKSRFNKAKKVFESNEGKEYSLKLKSTVNNSKNIGDDNKFSDDYLKRFLYEVKNCFFDAAMVKKINDTIVKSGNETIKRYGKQIAEKIGKNTISPKMKAITTKKFKEYINAYNARKEEKKSNRTILIEGTNEKLNNEKLNEKRKQRKENYDERNSKKGNVGRRLKREIKSVGRFFSSGKRKKDLKEQEKAYQKERKAKGKEEEEAELKAEEKLDELIKKSKDFKLSPPSNQTTNDYFDKVMQNAKQLKKIIQSLKENVETFEKEGND